MNNKIVIIDSSEFDRNIVKSIIDNICGFDIVNISNKVEFNSFLKNSDNVHLIIMDLSFPEPQNGIDILAILRKNETTKNVPVIVTTRHDSSTYKKAALSYNANDYIKKPYQIKRLESSIRSLIKIEEKFKYNFSEFINITFSFEEYLTKELVSCSRTGRALSMLIISPSTKLESNLKNKTNRHNEIDIIGNATEKIRHSIRSSDTVFQNKNGDIFVILPSTDSTRCNRVLEKVTKILEMELEKIGTRPNGQFFSVCVTFPQDGDDINTLVASAFKKIKDKKSLEEMTSILKGTEKFPNTKYTKYNK